MWAASSAIWGYLGARGRCGSWVHFGRSRSCGGPPGGRTALRESIWESHLGIASGDRVWESSLRIGFQNGVSEWSLGIGLSELRSQGSGSPISVQAIRHHQSNGGVFGALAGSGRARPCLEACEGVRERPAAARQKPEVLREHSGHRLGLPPSWLPESVHGWMGQILGLLSIRSHTPLQPSPIALASNSRLPPSPPTLAYRSRLQPSPAALVANPRLPLSPPTLLRRPRLQPSSTNLPQNPPRGAHPASPAFLRTQSRPRIVYHAGDFSRAGDFLSHDAPVAHRKRAPTSFATVGPLFSLFNS
jgi:hypothetical protein